MPESKSRKAAEEKKKGVRKAEAADRRAEGTRRTRLDSGGWVAPTFITLMLLGVLWLVVWYITAATGTPLPLISDLGQWNLGIGLVLMMSGFAVATQWK